MRRLLEPLDKRDDFQEGKAVVSHLTLKPGSPAQAVLEALAAGEPWDPLTRISTFALQDRTKQPPKEA